MRLVSLATWFKNTKFEPPFKVTTNIDQSGRVFFARLENEHQTIRFRCFDAPTGLLVFKSADSGDFEKLFEADQLEEVLSFLAVHLKEKENALAVA